VQDSPVFLDRAATIDKACDLIADAAREGAKLVVFPEAFVSAYPDWVWVVPSGKKDLLNDLYNELLGTAVTIPDGTTERLCSAAKKSKIHVVIGVNERNTEASNASLYNTLLYIDSTGRVLGKHRKLMPTGGERLVWAQGDGSTLDVFDTPLGKLGGLICWENYMPHARSAMYSLGTQIYIASTWDSSEIWLATMRHVAKEGGMFVIGCCTALHLDDIPDRYEFKKLYPDGKEWINPGNSCIIGPSGQLLAGPLEMKKEIIYARIDHSLIASAKWIFDVAGHYARPDVFQLTVNRNPNVV
ncbi:MAG: carbon-nitrogen hydrolase family protein, partial [Candidatus Latescibacterota bacterium]